MEAKYKCKICGEVRFYPCRFYGKKECKNCSYDDLEFINYACPICKRAMKKKHEGYVCSNWKCKLGDFKCGSGWCYIEKKEMFKEFAEIKWKNKITEYQNKKEWLQKRSEILRRDKFRCFLCGETSCLHVHHIVNRSEYPEFTFYDDNLVTVCEECHKKLHSQDKWRFS